VWGGGGGGGVIGVGVGGGGGGGWGWGGVVFVWGVWGGGVGGGVGGGFGWGVGGLPFPEMRRKEEEARKDRAHLKPQRSSKRGIAGKVIPFNT